ncbi:MAG: PAS domain S-box protein [Gemmatimonadota bacterium]|nr:PAS domain S-box protein [Gemmatimonadota bacterium]
MSLDLGAPPDLHEADTAPLPSAGEDTYRILFEANPTPLYVFDRDSLRFLAVNGATVAKYGYTREEFLAMTLLDLRSPEEGRRLRTYLRGETEGYAEPGPWRHRLRDGRIIQVQIATHTLEFQGHRAEMVMATDVTALQEATAELRQSEERFRLLSHATSDAIWDWDLVTRTVWRSASFETLFGLRSGPGEPTTTDWSDRLHPDERDEVVAGFQATMADGRERWDAVYRFARIDGSYATVRDHGYFIRSPDGRPVRAIGGMTDITESHRTARLLDASRQRHEDFHAALTCLTRRALIEGQDLDAVLKVITAKAAETLQVERVSIWLYTPDRTAIACDVLFEASPRRYSTGIMLTERQYPGYFAALATSEVIAAPDARTDPRTAEFTPDYLVPLGITSMLDAPVRVGGSLVGVLCNEQVGAPREWTPDEQSFAVSVANIVALVMGWAGSREDAHLLRQQASLLDQAQDAIMVRDPEGIITYWNHGAERIYGWTAAEAIGRPVGELLCANSAQLQGALRVVQEQGEWSGELEKCHRSGAPISVFARLSQLHEEGGSRHSVMAIDSDITERKRLERQFLRAQRLESIGILAGGIAHDLNNVLAPILLSIDLLRAGERDADRLGALSDIELSARRGADMVRQVLSFARGVEGTRAEVSLGRLLVEIGKVVNETFLKRIQLETQVAPDLFAVTGDATQLHQVLMNLCVNARDAMPAGGTLRLAARNTWVNNIPAPRRGKVPPGPFILVEVADTGTGISADDLDRIFDPFFSTKEVTKGTGLGLSTSLAIIESHGGFITVDSVPGKGSTFRVYLPTDGVASAIPSESHGEALPRGQGELVLVVDDESAIRQITSRVLERFGYRVISAANGEDALELFRSRPADIALVLTDMRMPGMDGATLIRHLRDHSRDLRIIGASGLQAEGNVALLGGLKVSSILTKPFTAGELLTTVRESLAGRGGPGAPAPAA